MTSRWTQGGKRVTLLPLRNFAFLVVALGRDARGTEASGVEPDNVVNTRGGPCQEIL